MSACHCDYDCTGDPLEFVKCSHGVCPLHDPCESCSENEGRCSRRGNGEWLCEECWVAPPVSPVRPALAVEPSAANATLTLREGTIAGLVARGWQNKAIAHELWVSEQTVKNHLQRVMRKLGVRNRGGVMLWVLERRAAA